MRILAHVHTLNDEDVIDGTLRALLDQSYALEEILIVDNGSTDGTLARTFPKGVTVIRHGDNRGTSGAVVTGMQYALDKGYDWIWLFDADSAPRPDALEKLAQLYRSFPPELQAETWLLASLPVYASTQTPWHGMRFTQGGFAPVQPDAARSFHEIDVTIWSGSLYKVAAVQKVGLPSADYVLNWGEFEYGYRGKQGRFRAFMHRDSILLHDTGGQPSVRFTPHRLGPLAFQTIDLPPIRLYYDARNSLYFWLHEYHRGCVCRFLRQSYWLPLQLLKWVLLLDRNRLRGCQAWLRGVRDGLGKNLHRRY